MHIIVDIDGTLADGTHRQHLIKGGPDNINKWKDYQALSHLDAVIEPIAHVVRQLYCAKNTILICTGRQQFERAATVKWLGENSIPFHEIFMRTSNDFRHDDIIKEELLDYMLTQGFLPQLVFEDRQCCVDLWRRRGLVCCQVAPGNF
jgi:hypothetical protein